MMMNGDTSGLPAPAEELHPAAEQRSEMENIFMGPNGMRAGWGLLLFVCIFLTCTKVEGVVIHHIHPVSAWFQAQDHTVMTAPTQIFLEGIALFALLVAAGVMALIEKRTYADYYLPMNEFLGKRFWQGVPYGFAMLSLALGMIAALHGFSLGSMALSGGDVRRIFVPRLHAGDAGFGNRVLAGGDYSFDFFWGDPSKQWRRSVVRRGDGGIVWRAGGVRFAADREFMVSDWNACGVGLVRDVFLFRAG